MDLLPLTERRTTEGHVLVVGSGELGQLGLGEDITERRFPFPLKDLSEKHVIDIASGGIHNLVLTDSGKIYSWGCNDQKALGRNDDDELHPVIIPFTESSSNNNVNFVRVYGGDSISVALTDDGKVYTWGTYRSSEGLLGFDKQNDVQSEPTIVGELVKEQVVDIAVGSDHVLALTRRGEVYSWGNGQNFQLGRRIVERRKINGTRPERVALKDIVKIGAGSYHSMAVDKHDNVYSWGLNNYGQCGISATDGGHDDTIKAPTLIRRLSEDKNPSRKVKQITGGEHHSAVLYDDGSLFTFGRSENCQLGLPFKAMHRSSSNLKDIHPEHHIPNADIDPEPDTADGPITKTRIRVPVQVPECPLLSAVACGAQFTVALTVDGVPYGWGSAQSNALANGDEDTDVERPMAMTGQRLANYTQFVRIDAGGTHTIMLGVPKESSA
ncbi:RCC1/BLIP-II [Ramicandelaber brevisporus]|nr:RCC1/BLIP-II [Ramicandelaber brevisporus]